MATRVDMSALARSFEAARIAPTPAGLFELGPQLRDLATLDDDICRFATSRRQS